MLAPFLMVGVGGSGGKTLRAVRHELRLRLREVGWEGDFPTCWQMVHIDVPSRQDGVQDLSGILPAKDFCGLVDPEIDYITVDRMLRPKTSGPEGLEAVGGWRPDPLKVKVPISDGAGQFRALGRMVSLAYSKRIRDFLDEVVRRLGSAEVTPELMELGRKFGADLRGQVPKPVAIVITSIAGGTGAGMAIDVCDLLRGTGDLWAGESIGVFYTPDVFNGLPAAARSGVYANALGTLMETLNAFWSRGYSSGVERQLLGVPANQLRRGAAFPLLVGSQNTGGVQFAEQVEVYRAAAKGLSALMISEVLQDNVVAYVKTNIWPQSTGMADSTPLKGGVAGNALLPFGALGFARVSLGRDLFGQYSKERLARLAVDRLLRQHLVEAPQEDRTIPDHAVKALVDLHFPRFVAAVGLSVRRGQGEAVASTNQVLDALRPQAEVRTHAQSAVLEIEGPLAQSTGDRPASRWLDEIVAKVRNRRPEWIASQREARTKRLTAWATETQTLMAEVVAWYAGALGLRVAEGLLVRLNDDLQSTARLLEEESGSFRGWAKGASGGAQQALRTDGAVPPKHPGIGKSIQKMVEGVCFEVDAESRDLAARVLDDLRENLVAPLAAAIGDARVGLESQENQPDSPIKRWPSGDDEPSSLLPGKTEFLVESVSTYPRRFLELVRETAHGEQPETAMRIGVRQIIATATPKRPVGNEPPARLLPGMADDGRALSPQQLVTFDASWEPRELGIGARAIPNVRCRASDLEARSEGWLFENQFPFERFLREDLQHYVQSPDLLESDRRKREQAFMDAFAKAARAASPLVGIDERSLVRAHNASAPSVSYQFSRVPFSLTSPVGSFVSDYVISNRLIDGANSQQTLNEILSADGSPVYRIDIFSTLSQPYHAVVFDSITRPILEEWNARNVGNRAADHRRAFWQWRRTRSFIETVPAAPEVVEAMVRGWFTAALLGQTAVVRFDDPDRLKVSVIAPEQDGHVPFPTPLLEYDPTDRRSLVPGLLLNLGIAIVTYGGTPEDFHSYQRLIDLGGSAHGSSLNPELLRYIETGAVSRGAPDPNGGSTWEERQKFLLDRIAKSVVSYEKLEDEVPREDAQVTPQWEMRRELVDAHYTLRSRIEGLVRSDGTL